MSDKLFFHFPCGCKFEYLDNSDTIKDYDGLPKLKIDFNNIPLDCKGTWDLISSGKTRGIFQLESNLGRTYSKKLEPNNLEHLAALTALLRPGCLGCIVDGKSMTNHYVDRKNNIEPVTYPDDRLSIYLSETFGVLVYQEQMIAMSKGLAGFSPERANKLRKSVGKKDMKSLLSLREEFISGCINNGLTNEVSHGIFDNIEYSGRYSFNACISADTLITKMTKGNKIDDYSVEHMFKLKNDINYAKSCGQISMYKKYKLQGHYGRGMSMFEDGRIRPNIIRDIRYAGKKEVFLIKLTSQNWIKVTANHKFPTPDGVKRTDELTIGSQLYQCGDYEKNIERYKFSGITSEQLKNKEKPNTEELKGFQTGINNPGYTNGSYTDFINNKKLLPNYCQICNKSNNRLETHHKNGNRENSTLENLINLCPSCHKKEEYKAGRTKKGEKGYPTELTTVQSIYSCGIEDVYDVEMDAPNHNFVANGDIVTCNSHSYGYGKLSYWTAYAKYHACIHFFCSSLKHVKDIDELKDLMSEVSLFDIQIKNPSISNVSQRFTIRDGYIQYGYGEIKEIGKDSVKLIEQVIELENKLGKPAIDFTWYEFLILITPYVCKTVINNLILCGLLDNTGISRTQQLHEYNTLLKLKTAKVKVQWLTDNYAKYSSLLDALIGLLDETRTCDKPKIESLIASLKKPGKSLDDSQNTLYKIETELMGIACSADPIGKKDRLANIKCIDFQLGKGASNLVFVVVVKNVDERTVKTGPNTGKKYANIKLADKTGEVEVTIFTKEWLTLKNIIVEGNVLLVNAYRNKDASLKIKEVEVL